MNCDKLLIVLRRLFADREGATQRSSRQQLDNRIAHNAGTASVQNRLSTPRLPKGTSDQWFTSPVHKLDPLLRPPTDLRGSTESFASFTNSGDPVLGQPSKAACIVPVVGKG